MSPVANYWIFQLIYRNRDLAYLLMVPISKFAINSPGNPGSPGGTQRREVIKNFSNQQLDSAVEYALLPALVAVAVITTATTLGPT